MLYTLEVSEYISAWTFGFMLTFKTKQKQTTVYACYNSMSYDHKHSMSEADGDWADSIL